MNEVRGVLRLLIGVGIVVAGLGLAASPAAAAPVLAVSQPTGLLDRQIVTVTGSGFAPGETVFVLQCIGAFPDACATTQAKVNENVSWAETDDSGAFAVTLRAHRVLGPPDVDPGGSCVDGDCSFVAAVDGDEVARTAIDFEPTGTAPGYAVGTTQLSTVSTGPRATIVDVDGSGFQPWFRVLRLTFGPASETVSLAWPVGAWPGAYLSVCPGRGLSPEWTSCERRWSIGGSPGTPGYGAMWNVTFVVNPDGSVHPEDAYLPRIQMTSGGRVDCAVEDCTYVLEQDTPLGQGQTVEWAPEWAPWSSADGFIDAAYAGLVGRAPTSAERVAATADLTDRTATARSFLMTLADRADGRRLAELARLYRAALGRRPDAAGLTYWADQLKANGGNMSAIARAFGRTSELRTAFGSGSDDTAVVQAYQRTLGRTPSGGEAAYWVGRLDAGLARTHMIHLFSRTPEYIGREGPRSRVAAVQLGLLGTVPGAYEWSQLDVDLANDPEAPWMITIDPIAWRIDDHLLDMLDSDALGAVAD